MKELTKRLSSLYPACTRASLPGTFRFFITSRCTPELDYYLATPAHTIHRSFGTENFSDVRQYMRSRANFVTKALIFAGKVRAED